MAIGPRLDLRQSQSLVITPQLQQAIQLLALSNLELEGFLREELDRNPLLESAGDDQATDGGEPAVPTEDGPADLDSMIAEVGGALSDEISRELAQDDGPTDTVVDEGFSPSLGSSAASDSDTGPIDAIDLDHFSSPATGLYEHLMAQAGMAFAGRDMLIASQIIGQIDEAGYLEADLRDIAGHLGISLPVIEGVLARIQQFDPTGVGARSLAECIMLQAREADRYDPAMAALIDNLDLVARGAMAQLRRICGVDDEDLVDMIRELRGYDPKPGLQFTTESPAAVVPDIIVRRGGQGWIIELNSATLPRVLVNRSYHRELSRGPQNKESKAWLGECLASANWLVRALDQRQRTILRVAEEIVRHQEKFFAEGVAHLRPLTLRQVGEAIAMHESTISRVTSNKYLQCPRGVFELKYFFTSGVSASDGGEAASAEAVKSHIRALIAAEKPDAILSDDTLVDMLRERGFDIARRTVAKYREAIGLGSSVQRRRQKALAGVR